MNDTQPPAQKAIASAVNHSDDEIDLMELFATLWRGRWWVLGVTGLVLAIAVIWLQLTPNTYDVKASFTALPKSQARLLQIDYNELSDVAEKAELNELAELAELAKRLMVDTDFHQQQLGRSLPVSVTDPKRHQKHYLVSLSTQQPEGVAATLNQLIAAASREAMTQYVESSVVAWRQQSVLMAKQLEQPWLLNGEAQARAELQKELAMLNVKIDSLLAAKQQVAAIEVISPAVEPVAPSKPRRKLILAVALVLGGMLGLFAVFIREGIASYRQRQIAG